jgi:hypothetical protein
MAIMKNLFLGAKVLIWGWLEPIRQVLGLSDRKIPLILILLVLLTTWLGSHLLMNTVIKGKGENKLSFQEKKKEIKIILLAFIAGSGLTMAGYIPFIFAYEPNLSGIISRVNYFSLFGASISLAAIIYLLACISAHELRRLYLMMGIMVAPFIIIGIFTQIWIQKDSQVAWEEQKIIWTDLFNIAPDLSENTTVYFIFPGYSDRIGFINWKRLPIQTDYGANAAIQALYGKEKLKADIFFPDIQNPAEPKVDEDGIVHYWYGTVTPYKDALFVIFEGNPRQLKIVYDLQSTLSIKNFTISTYVPDQHIIGNKPNNDMLRFLVKP